MPCVQLSLLDCPRKLVLLFAPQFPMTVQYLGCNQSQSLFLLVTITVILLQVFSVSIAMHYQNFISV